MINIQKSFIHFHWEYPEGRNSKSLKAQWELLHRVFEHAKQEKWIIVPRQFLGRQKNSPQRNKKRLWKQNILDILYYTQTKNIVRNFG